MTELNPKARALIQAGRRAYRPSTADRERIESALRERLGADALTPEVNAEISKSIGWQPAIGLILSLCVLGTVVFLELRPAMSTTPPLARPSPTVTQPIPRMADPPSDVATPAPPTRVRTAQTVDQLSPARARDGLAREVALLSRATSALRAGSAAAALKALDEHQRQFPNGTLTEERRAAKAQALCSLGRNGEGRAELARLAPHSPAAELARQLCDEPPSAAAR